MSASSSNRRLPNILLLTRQLQSLLNLLFYSSHVKTDSQSLCGEMTRKVDIFICGCGSAGLAAATWLARCGVRCKVVDSRPGPLEFGLADGIQTRSMEVLESLGVVDGVLREAYILTEMAFWNPGKSGDICRSGRMPTHSPGISHLPRSILSQATLHDMLLDVMASKGQTVDYGYKVINMSVDQESIQDPEAYPVTIATEKDGKTEVFKAKYALVCPSSSCLQSFLGS